MTKEKTGITSLGSTSYEYTMAIKGAEVVEEVGG
jgi:hypothetical protein